MNMGGDHHFPEPIIQHIQSFLTPKGAARTTILSKSWRDAWLTRPNLEFNQSDFPCRRWQDLDPFSEFAGKTLKRYEDSNRAIESFSIRAEQINPELIARALKIGATRLLIQFQNCRSDVVLPSDVVFGSENLVALTVIGCAISLRKGAVFRCSRLQSLCLYSVRVPSTGTITRILSSCPLIEILSLSNIDESPKDNRNNYNINDDGVLNGLHILRSLVLKYVYCDKLFLRDISTRFPSLKDLTLFSSSELTAYPHNKLLISSSSIERIDITIGEECPRPRIKFDVPNIRKFTYHSSALPSFSFRSTSSEWESHAYITRRNRKRLSAKWFLRLSKFLTKLRRSRIHLSLCVSYEMCLDYKPGEIPFPPALEIENLTINFKGLRSLSCYALLDALFRMCSPMLITQSVIVPSLRRALLQGVNSQTLTPNQFMYGLNDLKEAKAQIFDEVVSTWRDVSLDALSSEDSRKVRFQLDWATAAA